MRCREVQHLCCFFVCFGFSSSSTIFALLQISSVVKNVAYDKRRFKRQINLSSGGRFFSTVPILVCCFCRLVVFRTNLSRWLCRFSPHFRAVSGAMQDCFCHNQLCGKLRRRKGGGEQKKYNAPPVFIAGGGGLLPSRKSKKKSARPSQIIMPEEAQLFTKKNKTHHVKPREPAMIKLSQPIGSYKSGRGRKRKRRRQRKQFRLK